MYRLFVDSDNGLDVAPQYDYTEADKKVESRHRTRSGNEYVYRFGSWWDSNADLLWMEEGGIEVHSVHLVNKELPIGKPVKPYTDQFRGKIELGSY